MALSSLTSEQVDMAPHAGAQSISLAAAWRSQPKWVVSRSLAALTILMTRLILDHADKRRMGSTRDGHDL